MSIITTAISNIQSIAAGICLLLFGIKFADIAMKESFSRAVPQLILAILSGLFLLGGQPWFQKLFCMGAGVFGFCQ